MKQTLLQSKERELCRFNYHIAEGLFTVEKLLYSGPRFCVRMGFLQVLRFSLNQKCVSLTVTWPSLQTNYPRPVPLVWTAHVMYFYLWQSPKAIILSFVSLILPLSSLSVSDLQKSSNHVCSHENKSEVREKKNPNSSCLLSSEGWMFSIFLLGVSLCVLKSSMTHWRHWCGRRWSRSWLHAPGVRQTRTVEFSP